MCPEISEVNHYQEEIIAEVGMSLGYLPQNSWESWYKNSYHFSLVNDFIKNSPKYNLKTESCKIRFINTRATIKYLWKSGNI